MHRTQIGMRIETMPAFVVEKHIGFGIEFLVYCAPDNLMYRERMKQNPKWIHRVLEFKIT